MKLTKLLLVFAAGVLITLWLTGNLPSVSELPRHPHFPEFQKFDENGAFGIAGLIALILALAFVASNAARNETGVGSRFKRLRQLRNSETDSWLGGVCGGLGKATLIPSWVWRLGFAIAFFCYGTGFLLYVLLWVFIPEEEENTPVVEPQTTGFFGFLRKLRRSTTDCWLGGVCGGLAKDSVIPAWIWRLAFAALTVFYGAGLGFYIAMWIFVPEEKAEDSIPA